MSEDQEYVVPPHETRRMLLLLVSKLLDTDPRLFDYSSWASSNWRVQEGMTEPVCGTTACALGLATLIPEFQEKGLQLVYSRRLGQHYVDQKGMHEPHVRELGHHSLFVASKFFGISYEEAGYLFIGDRDEPPRHPQDASRVGERRSPPSWADPHEVAIHIKRFVDEYYPPSPEVKP